MADPTAAEQAVLGANSVFYSAFESGDLDAMSDLWVPEGHAVCIHPGWSPVVGAAAVRRSWAVIMANTPYIQFILTDVDVTVVGDVASVTCTENVLSADEDTPTEGFAGGKAVTTNVFRRTPDTGPPSPGEGRPDGGWRLWIHHASPVLSGQGSDEGE
ncbi:MAG: nuclear transport factor 2 family protein [Nocardioidaceae bacterium]